MDGTALPALVGLALLTSDNPSGTITNSDLELAGKQIHLEALGQTFVLV